MLRSAARCDLASSLCLPRKKNYPDAFFFKGLESGYLAATQDLEGIAGVGCI